MATADELDSEPMTENRIKSLNALLPELQTKVIVSNLKANLHVDAGGILNHVEMVKVFCEKSQMGQWYTLVNILKSKSNGAFEAFCRILYKGGYDTWTRELRKRAGLDYETTQLQDHIIVTEMSKQSPDDGQKRAKLVSIDILRKIEEIIKGDNKEEYVLYVARCLTTVDPGERLFPEAEYVDTLSQFFDACASSIRGHSMSFDTLKFLLVQSDQKRAVQELEKYQDIYIKKSVKSPTWMTQYKKAVDGHGSVSLNIIRCVLVGPSKVGKSCLKHLLIHNEPKEVTTSTPVLESPEVVTFTPELYMTHQGSSSVWQPIKNMSGMINKWTMEEQYDMQQTQTTSRVRQDEVSRPESPEQVGVNLEPSKLNSVIPSSRLPLLKALRNSHDSLFLDLQMGILADAPDQRQLTLIHILDSGGQLAFQDILPLLIGTPCTYVTVFNASVDLDQPVDITYRPQDRSEAGLDHQLNQWDMMLRTFSSIHTMEYKCHDEIRQILQDGSTLPHSRIAVVGTHKDKLETSPKRDYLKKKMNTLLGEIEDSKPYGLLHDQLQHGSPYFLLDNLQGIDQNYTNSLRKTLSSKECILPLKVPLMWLMVELTTQRLDQKLIPYNEMKQFCLQLKYISEEDADSQFYSLLLFFHSLGFYAFYELDGISKADNWVCTDAATLYREVSKLLVVQYKDTYTTKAARSFRKTGIIEDIDIKDLFNEVNILQTIDPKWFLSVLHHIGIAAKVTCEKRQYFFIPLALPFNRAVLPSKTSVSQLCFTLVYSNQSGPFSKQCEYDFPRGIFPHMVVHLVNQPQKLSDEGMWEIHPYKSDRTHIVFDCTTLCIYLIEQAGYIEVAILLGESFFHSSMELEAMQSKLHSLCRDIQNRIITAIKHSCDQIFGLQFTRRATVQSGFLCPCGGGAPHLAFMKTKELAQCSMKMTRLPRKLSSQEEIWFSPIKSDVQFSCFEDGHEIFWIMENYADTESTKSTQFDQKSFLEKYKDRFMEYVPAMSVVSKWEVYNLIDENTYDEVKKAAPSDKNAILFKYMRKNGSLHSIRKMCDFLIQTGKHGYPRVKALGEEMREDLNNFS